MLEKEKNKKPCKKGKILMFSGILLILCAFVNLLGNIRMDEQAGESAAYILSQVKQQIPEMTDDMGDSIGSVDSCENLAIAKEMATVEVDGESYIGTVKIPALGIELPILAWWDDELAKVSPCRYKGSAYDGNLIISGHNYKRHFGLLSSLSIGDSVIFKDINGMAYLYSISEIEIIDKYNIERMEEGNWDMTLFTCTLGGKQRITIRCVLKEN